MSIIKDLKSNNFLKIDKEAFSKLSHNAIIVYLNFADTHPNNEATDAYMAQKSNMSKVTYQNAKKELIKYEFLLIKRHGTKGAKIDYYFGKNAVLNYKQSKLLISQSSK